MDDASVDRLCSVLDEEARVCASLVSVLREEQEAVVALRAGANYTCLEQREMLVGELESLADRRRGLVRDIARACGQPVASATGLLGVLPADPQARLRERLHTLRRQLLAARGLERQNARLVVGGSETVAELLRALGALLPGTRYGADARLAPAGPTTEGVDRHV
jgi:flagellar biosynthesis/type III secretory pathway chaperone